MKVCFITGVNYLDFVKQGDFGFALTQFVLNNPYYANFYKTLNMYKILDNNAAETGVSANTDDVLKAAKIVRANEIWCVPNGEKVFGEISPKNIEECIKGERVLCDDGSFVPILKTFCKRYNGILINISPHYTMSFKVTPDHTILTDNGWKEAGKLTTNDCVVVPEIQTTRKTSMELYHPNQIIRKNKIFLKAGICNYGNSIPRHIPFIKDFFLLLGWYLAEGNIGSKDRTIEFNLSLQETKIARQLQKIIFDIFGLKSNIYRRPESGSLTLYCCSAILAHNFKQWFGLKATKKTIPYFIFTAPTKLIKAFIEGYVLGDGHKYENGSIRISTSSQLLARQLFILLVKIGIISSTTSFLSKSNYKVKGRFKAYVLYWNPVKKSEQFYTFKSKGRVYIKLKKIRREHYSGNVYNLETARRNFVTSCVIHNCPDKLYDSKYTLQATESFISTLSDSDRKLHKLAVIPQGKTKTDWVQCYTKLAKLDVDVIVLSKYSIPKCFPIKGLNSITYSRILAVKWLYKQGLILTKVPYHLAGADHNILQEIKELSKYPFIRSIDSNIAFKMGINKLLLQHDSREEEPSERLDFNVQHLDGQQITAITENINRIKQVILSSSKNSV